MTVSPSPHVAMHEVPWWLPAPRRRDMPNAGDGLWEGGWPLDRRDPAPPPSVPVVYYLYDDDGLCYIGSTDDLRDRLRTHAREKFFTRWTAQASRSRQHAYMEEKALIRRHKPRLNVMHVNEDEIMWVEVKPRRRQRAVFCGRCSKFVPPGGRYSVGTGAISCEACTVTAAVSA